jgi:hypothetical protein
MKKWSKILLVSVLSSLLCGCVHSSSSSDNSADSSVSSGVTEEVSFSGNPLTTPSSHEVEGAIHQFNHTKRSDFLVKDGKSDYRLLLPPQEDVTLEAAANDFLARFQEATGVLLPTSREDQVASNEKVISIGASALFLASGLKIDHTLLGSQGYLIKTLDNAIVVAGETTQAVSNGLYGLLHLLFHYEFYGPDTYRLDASEGTVANEDFDVLDAPDIEYRSASYSFASGGADTRRYRLTANQVIPVGGNLWHNSYNYISPDDYGTSHPEYFSDDKTQLCYLAHGDPSGVSAMQDIVVAKMEDAIKGHPGQNVITFTIQDTETFCDCDFCQASRKKYNGSNAAVIVQFLNPVAKRLEAWFLNEGASYKRDLKILFFAYHETNLPPVNFDEKSGVYTPIDDSVVCDPNVCVFFADTRGDYTRSYYDEDSANGTYIRAMKGWTACSQNFFFWTYQTNFAHYLLPYNTFNAMQDSYRFAIACHSVSIYDEGQFNQGDSATGWSFLKQYLTAQECWDVQQEQSALIADFFAHFYGKASTRMETLFQSWLSWASFQNDYLGYSGSNSIYYNGISAKEWPKNTLLHWLNDFASALSDLSSEDDKVAKARYQRHIQAERVAFEYLLLAIYEPTLTEEEAAFYKAQYENDVTETAMNYLDEQTTPILPSGF